MPGQMPAQEVKWATLGKTDMSIPHPGVLRLAPLTADESDALLREEVRGELRERIAQAAGGNALFL